MEKLHISIFVVYSFGISLVVTLGLALHMVCRRGIRRYERVLDDSYSKRFERRTVVAKSAHRAFGADDSSQQIRH